MSNRRLCSLLLAYMALYECAYYYYYYYYYQLHVRNLYVEAPSGERLRGKGRHWCNCR